MIRLMYLTVAVVVLVGCSAGDDPGDAAPSSPSTVADPTVSPGGAAGPEGEHRLFCEAYVVVDRLFDQLPDGSLEEIQASVGTLAEEASGLADGAPSEVSDDAQVMATYFAQWRDAAAGATTSEAAVDAATDLATATEFQVAGQRLHGWVTENCPA